MLYMCSCFVKWVLLASNFIDCTFISCSGFVTTYDTIGLRFKLIIMIVIIIIRLRVSNDNSTFKMYEHQTCDV